jgi:hypothetical protein
MAKFWLATFQLESPLESSMAKSPSPAVPLAVPGAKAWAVEVIEAGDERAVLFSTVDDAVAPQEFVCRIGFANGSKRCALWGDRGFPLIDAVITLQDNRLRIRAPGFLAPPAMEYEADLVTITNMTPVGGAKSSSALDQATYEQALRAPDARFPATRVAAKSVTWLPKRTNVKEFQDVPANFGLAPAQSRYPNLAPFKDTNPEPTAIWSGDVDLPKWPPAISLKPFHSTNRADTFGVAAFRFEDVEVLGFRVDLKRLGGRDDEGLAAFVDPLNFHLNSDQLSRATRSAVSDFRYRPASQTVMVELLRYGKMKLQEASPPLDVHDFQSQHELLARILVGRVDDDTAQARDPATFVPTIFVDNSWSKSLARSVQGFDKRMAKFCISENGTPKPLRPDGRLMKDDREPRPLGSITEIVLARASGEMADGSKLLELDCPYHSMDDWDAFEKIDLQVALGPLSIFPVGWGQTDFGEAEYSRSFARSVAAKTFRGIGSIQASPVGAHPLKQTLRKETTWITGTMTYAHDSVRVVRPHGTVGLTFHGGRSAPQAWKELCKLFGDEQISLPMGNWYRMRCSMDLKIHNGFE